jgi:cytochrome c553
MVAVGMAIGISAQEPILPGSERTVACAACHGAVGNTALPDWPKIAGLDDAYIVAQLRAYQAGQRSSVLMAPHAKPLTEQTMRDLAQYYASQKMSAGTVLEGDKNLVDDGGRIYQSGIAAKKVAACGTCHGPTGNGNPSAGATRLGGQNGLYVAAQLQAFRSGQRVDPTKVMAQITAQMADDEMRTVAVYIAGLSDSAPAR